MHALSALMAVWLFSVPSALTYDFGKRPNIIFILSDDQDLEMGSIEYMPLLDKYLRAKGTTYERHYCTTALCCPARASILTGKMAHNHNVTDVVMPFGGYTKVVQEGINDDYLPLWLQEAGWDTYYVGKLWNSHSTDNYNSPRARGWNGSDFLLDPYTYDYYNPTFVRNYDEPIHHENEYSTDLVSKKALGFIDDASKSTRPFFLGVAPIAPHSNTEYVDVNGTTKTATSAPIPAKRHETLFEDVVVPRTPHFNPETPSSVYWVHDLPRLNQTHIDANDLYYRQRLRSLQAVDEMIEAIVQKLEHHGMLNHTYIIFTTDNGFHIGQHRLEPGKFCPFEEDVHIPLFIRGPGVPENQRAPIVTTHTDLAPTFLSMVGASMRANMDGEVIPLTKPGIDASIGNRYEHVQVEYWGYAVSEGDYSYQGYLIPNNTYKALRIVSDEYSFYYSIWCNNEHELYDMKNDPYQLDNLFPTYPTNKDETVFFSRPLSQVLTRFDALTLVLKTCKSEGCVKPWKLLHPAGDVKSLKDAIGPKFDSFYENGVPKVKYDHCSQGFFLQLEGPVYNQSISFIPI
ncbi:Arylsulphatase [Nemania sp. FL0031]|nr:Arylsulphatase [Nemania sp. FL0031]